MRHSRTVLGRCAAVPLKEIEFYGSRKARLRRWRRGGTENLTGRAILQGPSPSSPAGPVPKIRVYTLQGSIREKVSLRPPCAPSAAKFLKNEARRGRSEAPFICLFTSSLAARRGSAAGAEGAQGPSQAADSCPKTL